MDQSKKKRIYYPIVCGGCNKILDKKNFPRHCRLRHPSDRLTPPVFAVPALPTGIPSGTPATSIASSAMCPETMSESSASASIIGPSPERLSHLYERAAKAMLKQHHQYTEEDLTEFLAKEYPGVPEDQRQALIIGATAAAQSVAHLYVLWNASRTGTDPASKGTTEAAERSLSFYNLGLMSRDRNDHLPQTIMTSAAPASTTESGMITASITSGGIPLMTLPVPRSETNVDHPHIELDEEESSEDELGHPPSFEIVDEQPMSAQRPRTTKSTSEEHEQEETPDREPEVEVPTHDPKCMLQLVQELQRMLAKSELPSPPPRGPGTDTPIRQPVATGESASAKHSLPPVVDPARSRRGVSPYVPASKGPTPMITYRPSAKPTHTKPHYYPGSLIAVTSKRAAVPSAALGRPPPEPPTSTRPSRERRHESRCRRESRHREKSPERRHRRGRASRSRSASSRNRLSPTPPRGSRSRCER